MKRAKLKRINALIQERTQASYRSNKESCRFENWKARLYAYFSKGKNIFPPPSQQDKELFKKLELNTKRSKRTYGKTRRSEELFY